MSTKPQTTEQKKSSTSAEEYTERYSEETIERTKVDGTPFTIIEVIDRGCFLAVGSSRITEIGKYTKRELIKMIDEKDWQIIEMLIISICYFIIKDQKNPTDEN